MTVKNKGAAKPRPTRHGVLLFEDRESNVAEFAHALGPYLGADLELVVFPLNEAPAGTGPYEDQLLDALEKPQYSNVVLVVTDRDLSTQAWGGLSEAAVTRAASQRGLPVACYRQAVLNVEDRLRRVPGDGQIELPEDLESRAAQVAVLARGFVLLEKLVREHQSQNRRRQRSEQSAESTPGQLLASILRQPITASHFDSYACADQGAVEEILNLSEDATVTKKVQRRLIVALGVWLADVVMQYPGLLVDEVAAASYLDIHPRDFEKPHIRTLFDAARFRDAPFANEARPMWWKHLLDDLLDEAGAGTGRDLCGKQGIKRVRFCPCSVDDSIPAGYYCMATAKPLSGENSSGRVNWFPPGAELARLTKSTHRKLAPWIGS